MNDNYTITREPHAGHYADGGGHDLEWIDITKDTDLADSPIPAGFVYHSGYRDRSGVQHHMYCRRASLSPGRCGRC